ncbi:MAG: membrane lipoprotein lipid attachment site-containing protein [Lachnospiraceae bacterium]|nr:membrane lipoprotein lipid attachment site-containing protein [Lachnospiraceae bacterium]
MKKITALIVLTALLTACSTEAPNTTPLTTSTPSVNGADNADTDADTDAYTKHMEEEGWHKGDDGKWHKESETEYVDSGYIPWDKNSEIKDVDPSDYFISESEFDLVGFMRNFGFTLASHDKDTIQFKRVDGVTIFIFATREGFREEFVGMTVLHDMSFQETDYIKNHGEGGYTHLTGDLSEVKPFNTPNFVRTISEMPKICRNIRDGHCPYYETVLVEHSETTPDKIFGGDRKKGWHFDFVEDNYPEVVVRPGACN